MKILSNPHPFSLLATSIMMLFLYGCNHSNNSDCQAIDSIFNSYHRSESAFTFEDIQILAHYSDSINSHYGKILAHLDMASLHSSMGDQEEALHHLQQVDISPSDPPFALAYTDYLYGLVYQHNTDYCKALYYYKRAAPAFEDLNDTLALISIYTNISEIYSVFEIWDLHEQYFSKAHSLIADSLIVGYGIAADSIYTMIHQGQLEKALATWHRYDVDFQKQQSTTKLQNAYEHNHYDQIQTIHLKMRQYDSAEIFNSKLLSLVSNNPHSPLYADASIAKAQILLGQGNSIQALEECHFLTQACHEGVFPINILLDIFPTLINCYSALGWTDSVRVASEEYLDAIKSYNIQVQRNNILQNQIEERYEQLIKSSIQERQMLKIRLLILSIITLIIILVLLTLVILKQKKHQQELSMRLKSEQELDLTQHQLAQSQMKQAKIQEQILTFSEQMKQLASDMPKTLKAKTFLNLEQIRQQRDSEIWASFEEAFEKEYGDFKSRLKAAYPNINNTDIKICMLMKTQMQSKDIAVMLHLTPESLRTFRYNLRKKLNLKSQNITLEKFIQHF